MSELDSKRKENILNTIKDNQVIITCTDKISLENTEENTVYKIENGKKNKGWFDVYKYL